MQCDRRSFIAGSPPFVEVPNAVIVIEFNVRLVHILNIIGVYSPMIVSLLNVRIMLLRCLDHHTVTEALAGASSPV